MSKRILIIEDDANLLYGLQAKLRVQGYATDTDQGLDQAVIMEKIKSLRPDSLILDIILPRADGFDILKAIKADPQISRTLVFVFTNLSDNDSRNRAEKLGADFYLLKKDFNLDQFVEKFNKIITNAEN